MPDNIVIKKNGKFEIVPSDAQLACAESKADKAKTKNQMSEPETRALLERILIRLEALERPAA